MRGLTAFFGRGRVGRDSGQLANVASAEAGRICASRSVGAAITLYIVVISCMFTKAVRRELFIFCRWLDRVSEVTPPTGLQDSPEKSLQPGESHTRPNEQCPFHLSGIRIAISAPTQQDASTRWVQTRGPCHAHGYGDARNVEVRSIEPSPGAIGIRLTRV